ncbi:MAG: hypothetical protein Fur005_08660 [Roseiflexaceae bacterium]
MALPLPSMFVAGIVEHINSDHRAQMIDLAQGLAGQRWVEDASLIAADTEPPTGIESMSAVRVENASLIAADTEGVDLQVVGAKRSEQIRIVFDQPIVHPNEFRPAMIALIHRAQMVLGKELLVEEEEEG